MSFPKSVKYSQVTHYVSSVVSFSASTDDPNVSRWYEWGMRQLVSATSAGSFAMVSLVLFSLVG